MTDFPDLGPDEAASYLWPPCTVEEASLSEFQSRILDFYHRHGRTFPWRESGDAYHILLSEVMLQQTQTSRALPKYELFLSLWPTIEALAGATLLDLLTAWKGLGYNRRALYLHQSAKACEAWGWKLPSDEHLLRTLPGVGKATAAALMAFAFGERSIYLETNIRRVIIHSFFRAEEQVTDRQVEAVLSRLLDGIDDYRSWYYALMDYGVLLKALLPNPNRKSAHYRGQSAFENSNRQIRGLLIHLLSEGGPKDGAAIGTTLGTFEWDRVVSCLEALTEEGFVEEQGGVYGIRRV
ncbi:MAG: DNA repair protein [Spirochaetota bacterium]|jgi:A/G-specific adenine glycosylase|nr:DNA repair protein [Spirochaetota bacterium]HPK46947.1 DNA repair protein [Sphaerochaeta sp.]